MILRGMIKVDSVSILGKLAYLSLTAKEDTQVEIRYRKEKKVFMKTDKLVLV